MTLNVTNKLLTPLQALAKYGYKKDVDGLWKKDRGENAPDTSSEQWLQVDGGWLCFSRRLTFGAIPAGWPVASLLIGKQAQYITGIENNAPVLEDAPGSLQGLVQVPQGPAEDYGQASGLHPAAHPFAFRWVWTDDEVAFIYGFAEEGWVKEQDPATGAITMRQEGTPG
jgi:hypothetical protein